MNQLEKKTSSSKRATQLSQNKKQPSKLSKNPNILKNLAQYQEERLNESKPFGKLQNQKLFAKNSQDPTHTSSPVPSHSQAKRYSTVNQDSKQSEQKSSTKQTFNQRLNHNIIRDEEGSHQAGGTKQSFRIKKVDSRSPKKMRDDLIIVNEQEYKLQRQIVELHKKHKQQLKRVMSTYKIPIRSIADFISPKETEGRESRISQQATEESVLRELTELAKAKQKAIQKHQRKVSENTYHQYVLSQPVSDNPIPELSSSEEDDLVQELPASKPRLTSNSGSYCVAMASIKNKNYGLNMRRTYDVFKEGDSMPEMAPRGEPGRQKNFNENPGEQVSIKQGENKMTMNKKFKDFLLQ